MEHLLLLICVHMGADSSDHQVFLSIAVRGKTLVRSGRISWSLAGGWYLTNMFIVKRANRASTKLFPSLTFMSQSYFEYITKITENNKMRMRIFRHISFLSYVDITNKFWWLTVCHEHKIVSKIVHWWTAVIYQCYSSVVITLMS